MKYKLKPQTALLVGGLLAASYANACLYQATSVLCAASGDTIDTIYWNSDYTGGTGKQPVTATMDWVVVANGSSSQFSFTGAGFHGTNYSGYIADNGTFNSTYCSGPAQFKDFSLHSTSVTWVANSANTDGLKATAYPIYSRYLVNGVNTIHSGGADTTSSTCTQ
jgi:hypothetical protein